MHKTIALFACLILALGLTACGGNDDGSDFVGTYEVTKHTLNDAACDAEGPDVTGGETHFKLEMGDLFGFPILQYFPCSSATECDGTANFGFAKISGKWVIQTKYSYELGEECHLGEVNGTLDGTELGISIDVKTSEGVVTPAGGEECDPDLVDKYHDQLVCNEYEVVEGTLLE
jgi:hypothetical protein